MGPTSCGRSCVSEVGGCPPGERLTVVGGGRGQAVARLVLAGRSATDLSAGPVPGPQPVAEVALRDLLEQREIVLEVGQHLLPLLPGQGLAGARAALEVPFERLGEGGARG